MRTLSDSLVGAIDQYGELVGGVMFCALIGMLCFFELLEYCSRRRGRRGGGLKKSALTRMPVVVYQAEAPAGGDECAICLGEFEDGDAVRLLPRCRHGFHVGCIDTSCPTCRDELLDVDEGGEATVAGEDT